jgi:hypothetical protein
MQPAVTIKINSTLSGTRQRYRLASGRKPRNQGAGSGHLLGGKCGPDQNCTKECYDESRPSNHKLIHEKRLAESLRLL